jgi:hypothetical protein
LGELVLELSTGVGDAAPPDAEMFALAEELVAFVIGSGELLLDLIYGHYRYAEEREWLEYSGVPAGLGLDQILEQVNSVKLDVSRRSPGKYDAGMLVNPKWDPEHKLDLTYRDGQIVEANGEPYVLVDEVLCPTRRRRGS